MNEGTFPFTSTSRINGSRLSQKHRTKIKEGKIMNENNLTGLLSRRSRAGVLASGLLGARLVIIAVSACTGVGLAGPDSERRISARESEDHRLRRGHRSEDKIILGETTEIAGGMASTWARVKGFPPIE